LLLKQRGVAPMGRYAAIASQVLFCQEAQDVAKYICTAKWQVDAKYGRSGGSGTAP